MPRLVRLLIAALGLALVADARAAVAPGFTQTAYVTGLDTPTAIAFLPDHRLLVAEKGGFSGSGKARPSPVSGMPRPGSGVSTEASKACV